MKKLLGILFILALVPLASPATAKEIEPPVNDDGLYTQTWFLESFMELESDLKEAAQAGKRFAIMWEQKGCPYCRETHRVNLADEATSKYIRDNFVILQLNLWGDREVTDFDGEVTTEKKLARKWGVVFTPTVMFFPPVSEMKKEPGNRQVSAIMPGYFKPFHFVNMFKYVKSESYKRLEFQRYLREVADKMQEEGKSVVLW